jgi:hypothetical protein
MRSETSRRAMRLAWIYETSALGNRSICMQFATAKESIMVICPNNISSNKIRTNSLLFAKFLVHKTVEHSSHEYRSRCIPT